MSPVTDSDAAHVCVLDERFRGLRRCRCGRWWMRPAGDWLDLIFVRSEVRQRLRDHKLAIELGRYENLAEAVKDAAFLELVKIQENAERDAKRWHAKQAAKRSRWWRAMTALILDGRPCVYCGDPEPNSIDHVIPQCQGGSDAFWNLAAACKTCNRQKNGRTPEQWKQWCLARGRTWPPVFAGVQR